MENVIKIGGAYKSKDGGSFLYVNKKMGVDLYSVRDIIVDEDGDDIEILDMTTEEIREKYDTENCWTLLWHKKYGVYGYWDGANRETFVLLNPHMIEIARARGFKVEN